MPLTVPGAVSRKLRTSVDTQLVVFDKTDEDVDYLRASVADLGDAAHHVAKIGNTRANSVPRNAATSKPKHPLRKEPPTAQRRVQFRKHGSSNALAPITFQPLATQRENTPVSDIYARYRPQRIEI